MKSDSQIREEVIQELRWDPQVTDPDAIGVAVKDGNPHGRRVDLRAEVRGGSVPPSLYGHVHSLNEAKAARAAAASAPGIASVESHLVVTP